MGPDTDPTRGLSPPENVVLAAYIREPEGEAKADPGGRRGELRELTSASPALARLLLKVTDA
jgi:hypothetical protein